MGNGDSNGEWEGLRWEEPILDLELRGCSEHDRIDEPEEKKVPIERKVACPVLSHPYHWGGSCV